MVNRLIIFLVAALTLTSSSRALFKGERPEHSLYNLYDQQAKPYVAFESYKDDYDYATSLKQKLPWDQRAQIDNLENEFTTRFGGYDESQYATKFQRARRRIKYNFNHQVKPRIRKYANIWVDFYASNFVKSKNFIKSKVKSFFGRNQDYNEIQQEEN